MVNPRRPPTQRHCTLHAEETIVRRLLAVILGAALAMSLVSTGLIGSLDRCGSLPYVHPLPIDSAGILSVSTDHGRLLPGQTYHYFNEGPWVGSVTLLFSSPGHALVLVHYPRGDTRAICLDSFP